MPGFKQLLPNPVEPDRFKQLSPMRMFAPETLSFISALSNRLLRTSSLKAYPELMALGFWMRGANLARLRQQFENSAGQALFQPRGTAFHIAPSNVDSIFIYSWFLSMICGNKNIVRLSSRGSPQLDLLIGALADLLSKEEWRSVAEKVLLVRYDHDADLTTYFSQMCDVRVIWGGNATVSEVRRLPLPPVACEVMFASKFSVAIVNAENWNSAAECRRQDWLGKFFNDVYWFGQMACSSPRLLIWHGAREAKKSAQDSFWSGMTDLVRERKTDLMPIDYVNKIVAADLIALKLHGATIHNSKQSDICRVEVERDDVMQLIDLDLHCGAGLFYETAIDTLDSLLPILDRRIQTVAYAGYDGSELRDFVSSHTLRGIDRIVPFGQALEFTPIWDGFDLFRVFLRQVTVDSPIRP
jgi:hypothetical protein